MLAEPISLRQIAGIIIVFIGVLITVRSGAGEQKMATDREQEITTE